MDPLDVALGASGSGVIVPRSIPCALSRPSVAVRSLVRHSCATSHHPVMAQVDLPSVASPLSLGFGITGTTHVHLQWDPPRCVFGSKRARLPCQGLPPTLADPGVQGHLADQQHPMVTAVEVERLVWRRTDAA